MYTSPIQAVADAASQKRSRPTCTANEFIDYVCVHHTIIVQPLGHLIHMRYVKHVRIDV